MDRLTIFNQPNLDEIELPLIITDPNTALRIIGWGCPLHSHIANMTAAVEPGVLGVINWLLPLSEVAGLMYHWVTCIMMYYIASIAMRWAKAIA